MDDFTEGAEEIFDDAVDGIADAIGDIDAGEVWEDVTDGATEAWDTVSDEVGELLE
ncbi:hypothetical protein [Glycomyces paridis]|uniref:hypothetical protein n=1 Tax=Glycomyces paridis TaxID=2126555 RepID=UPI0013051450|nr:hypothetical protein [Glycomyces paridis]